MLKWINQWLEDAGVSITVSIGESPLAILDWFGRICCGLIISALLAASGVYWVFAVLAAWVGGYILSAIFQVVYQVVEILWLDKQ